ncbi:carbohydrate ABC transporter permease [Microbacterium halophytorum]|uniref:carbohydrate ABC transporter permease n=1 Tax=Microbacterium halophytorum TaxID=2067568 RepID=UPI000CFCAFD8|nr:carbohydrate ABC transporter permease [Microbacterium halophytorum]
MSTAAPRNRTAAASAGRYGRIVTMVVVAAFFLLPILGFVMLIFQSEEGLRSGEGGLFGIGALSWENVVYSWNELSKFGPGDGHVFQRWLLNSVVVATSGTIIAVVAAIPAGYAFARLRFRFRKAFLFVTLLAMVMPNTVLVIPIFLEVNAIGAIGQLWPVAVIMGFFPFGVYLAYIHFMTTMPHELLEAARIDGLGEVKTFFQIGVPLAKQAIALVAFFSFVANWINFFLPLALLTSSQENKLISIGIQELIGASPMFNATVAAGLDVKLYLPQLALATVVSMLPLMAMFLGAQRFLVKGQTVGAVKG